jgi:hypothetical protein
MSLLSRLFQKGAPVAYHTWHVGSDPDACTACRDLDGTCWLPERKDFKGPPLRSGCTCTGGCSCRILSVRMDEAWGPGNAEWIRKRGGVVSGEQMKRFLSS